MAPTVTMNILKDSGSRGISVSKTLGACLQRELPGLLCGRCPLSSWTPRRDVVRRGQNSRKGYNCGTSHDVVGLAQCAVSTSVHDPAGARECCDPDVNDVANAVAQRCYGDFELRFPYTTLLHGGLMRSSFPTSGVRPSYG